MNLIKAMNIAVERNSTVWSNDGSDRNFMVHPDKNLWQVVSGHVIFLQFTVQDLLADYWHVRGYKESETCLDCGNELNIDNNQEYFKGCCSKCLEQ